MPIKTRALAFAVARRTGAALRRGWLALVLVSVVAALAGAIGDLLAAAFARWSLPAQFATVHAWAPAHVFTILAAEAGIARTVLEGAGFVLGFGAAALVTATALEAGDRVATRRAVRMAAARLPQLLTTYLAVGVIAAALAVASAPLLLLAPIGIPTAIAGAALWRQAPARRRLARWLIVAGLPFGLLVDGLMRLSVALPAAAVEGDGPVTALLTSRDLVRRRWWPVAVVVVGITATVLVITIAATLLVGAAGAVTHPGAALPAWTSVALVATGIALSEVPAVALTALYIVLRDEPPDLLAAGVPAPRRSPSNRPAAVLAHFQRLAAGAIVGTVIASAAVPVGTPAYAATATPARTAAPTAPAAPAANATPARTATPTATAAPTTTRTATPAALCSSPPPPGPAGTRPAATSARPATASSFVVTTTADCVTGSLRDAIDQANAATGGSLITFALSGTFTMTQVLVVTGAVTIDGSGQAVVLDGGGATAVLTSSTNPITIQNLTVAHGNGASGSGFAGGVSVNGNAVTVNNVTFESNTGDAAGGLLARGPATITNSTFHANTGTNAGGAGGALTITGTATVTNSTFVGNGGTAATGGGILDQGSLTADGITVVESTGGGISALSHALTLTNSYLQGNNLGDCEVYSNAIPPPAGNVDGDNSCGGGGLAQAGNYTQNLGSHGGATQTIEMLPGSPAVGAGTTNCPALDQRGIARNTGACTAGAYEFRPQVSVTLASNSATYNLGDIASLTATVTATYEPQYPVGNVTFYDGPTALGTAALAQATANSSTAVLGTSALAIGPHTLTAAFAGQTNGFSATTSAGVPVTVAGYLSTLSLGSSLNPATVGDSVTLTATLASGPAGSATGTVSFYDGTTLLATQPLASDTATFTTSALAFGHHSLSASYSGDSNHGLATGTLDQNVRAATTTTATAASPAEYGTASVSVTVSGGTTTPTGGVTCSFPSNVGGASLDSSGRATCPLQYATPGSGTVTVTYNGDGSHAGSTTSVPLTITAAPTSQSLVASPPAPVYGQPVTLTDTVVAAGTPSIAAGSVTFATGSSTVATVTLDGSGAASTSVLPPVGPTTYSSSYTPNNGFAATAPGSATVTVAPAPTTTALQASSAASVTGQAVTLTATVTTGGGSTLAPTGSVTFSDGSGFSQSVAVAAAAGPTSTAAVTTSTLAVGGHSFTATFVPGTGFLASASTSTQVTVSAAATHTALSVSPPSPVGWGQAVTLTALVGAVAPGSGTPAGSVEFFDGSTDLGPGTLDGSGQANLHLASPAVGSHSYTAGYGGSARYSPSTSAATAFSVGAAATVMTISGAVTGTYGAPATFTAHVTATNGTPVTGTVDFHAMPTYALVGSAAIDSSGNATLTTSILPGGSTEVDGLFNTTTDFAGSTAAQHLAVPVAAATPTFQFSVSPDPSTYFDSITLHVTVVGITPTDHPLGWVKIYVDNIQFTEMALTNGSADYQVANSDPAHPLLPYTHSLTASYSYNYDGSQGGNYASGYSPNFLRFSVNPVAPTVAVTVNPDPAGIQLPFDITATITGQGGVVPTGSVTFYSGSAGLDLPVTVAPNGTATLRYSGFFTGGTNTIRAVYSPGSGPYGTATGTHVLLVEALPTTVRVGINTTPPWVAGHQLALAASVGSTAAIPDNNVVAFYDGTAQVCSGFTTGGTGDATCNTTLTAGSHTITARYFGSTSFAPSSASTTVSIYGESTAITAGTTGTPTVGQFIPVSWNLHPAGSSTSPATGRITVTGTDGQTCSNTGITSSCYLYLSTPGSDVVSVSFAGDATYAPSATSLTVDVLRVAPYLSATIPYGTRWVNGETVPVSWQLLGGTPAATGTVTIQSSSYQGCATQPLTGTCDVPITTTGAQTITVSYSGDSTYAPATRTLTGNGLACHNFAAYASPGTWGSLELIPAPDCNHGRGYVDGDSISVFPHAAAHHVFSSFDGYPGQSYLNLTITQDTQLIGRFDWLCDSVTVDYVFNAIWFPTFDSDCGATTTNAATHAVTFRWRDGDSITLAGQDYFDAVKGPYNFHGWFQYAPSQVDSSASGYTFTVVPGMELRPIVTRPCYTITTGATVPNGATFSHFTPGTCSYPDGPGAYYYGDDVRFTVQATVTTVNVGGGLTAVADPSYYLDGESLTGTDRAAGLQPVANALPNTFHLVVHGDNTVTAAVSRCRHVTTGISPTDPTAFRINNGYVYPAGYVAVRGKACEEIPGYPLDDWFAGPVTVTATAASGLQFYGWEGDVASGLAPGPRANPATLDGAANHRLTAAFGPVNSCFAVPLEIGSPNGSLVADYPGWQGDVIPTSTLGTIRLSGDHKWCPGNLFPADSTVLVELDPQNDGVFVGAMGRTINFNPDGSLNSIFTNLSGPLGYDLSPLTGSDIDRSQQQFFVQLPHAGGGKVTGIQAWFCYPVAVTQYATAPNGTPFDPTSLMTGLDASAPQKACPVGFSTFPAGTSLTANASPQPGYTFTQWTGNVPSTGRSVSFTVNGPVSEVASFAGACYKLTVDEPTSTGHNGGDEAIRSDTPNCPGYPDSAGMYLAGTAIALQAIDKGDKFVFNGWEGADTTSGTLAVVTMNSDRALHAHYNDDLEHPTANWSAFGTEMSAVGKVALGAVATALSDYVINFTDAGLVGLVGAVGTGLGDLGVPGASMIGQVMNDLSATMTGPLDCIGSWGLSSGGAAPSTDATAIGGDVKSAAGTANSVVDKARGEGLVGKAAHWFTRIRDAANNNAGTLDKAAKTAYALKWIAMGVELGTQLSTATLNADWGLSTFEDQFAGCLRQRGEGLAGDVAQSAQDLTGTTYGWTHH